MPAIAPRLTSGTSAANEDLTPAFLVSQPLRDRQTLIIDGCRVDKSTGEIYGYFSHGPFLGSDEIYDSAQISLQTASNGWLLDPHSADKDVSLRQGMPDEEDDEIDIPSKSGAGRKPRVVVNELARHIQVAHEAKSYWLDDYVYGACYVCTGASNGKLNVSPSDVRRVAMMPIISTQIVRNAVRNHNLKRLSKRQAQRLVKCAKWLLDGIAMHLSRDLEALSRLENGLYELELDAEFALSFRATRETCGGNVVPFVRPEPCEEGLSSLTTDIESEVMKASEPKRHAA